MFFVRHRKEAMYAKSEMIGRLKKVRRWPQDSPVTLRGIPWAEQALRVERNNKKVYLSQVIFHPRTLSTAMMACRRSKYPTGFRSGVRFGVRGCIISVVYRHCLENPSLWSDLRSQAGVISAPGH